MHTFVLGSAPPLEEAVRVAAVPLNQAAAALHRQVIQSCLKVFESLELEGRSEHPELIAQIEGNVANPESVWVSFRGLYLHGVPGPVGLNGELSIASNALRGESGSGLTSELRLDLKALNPAIDNAPAFDWGHTQRATRKWSPKVASAAFSFPLAEVQQRIRQALQPEAQPDAQLPAVMPSPGERAVAAFREVVVVLSPLMEATAHRVASSVFGAVEFEKDVFLAASTRECRLSYTVTPCDQDVKSLTLEVFPLEEGWSPLGLRLTVNLGGVDKTHIILAQSPFREEVASDFIEGIVETLDVFALV